jgi:hypothetical protein
MKMALGIAVSVLIPTVGWACACGCGVFDVRTRSMFPTGEGGLAFFEYDFMDQDRNWSGTSSAPGADNPDKEIRTDYYAVGGQYMFSRQWGVIAQAPYETRYFKTTDDDGHIVSFTHGALGDASIKAIYAGLSPDMSSGVTFGLKLPTGDSDYRNFDCDTQIGMGSTDILLGVYLMGRLPDVKRWDWFANCQIDQPALTKEGYRPGSEVDAVAGTYYNGWRVKGVKIAPVAQIIGSHHWRDCGSAADPDNTGYNRVLLAPGVEFDVARVSLYADVALPAYQDVNGNQLVAPALFTVRMSCAF